MGGVGTPAAEGAQTPQSQDDSDLAPSFYQNNSTKKRQTGSRLADTSATVVGDDDDDDLMEPELPGREERVSLDRGAHRLGVAVLTICFSKRCVERKRLY